MTTDAFGDSKTDPRSPFKTWPTSSSNIRRLSPSIYSAMRQTHTGLHQVQSFWSPALPICSFVRLSVVWSWSVSQSNFTFMVFRSLISLLLPKCACDLKYYPCLPDVYPALFVFIVDVTYQHCSFVPLRRRSSESCKKGLLMKDDLIIVCYKD